jgi:CubicO group peptidase (beta-lactamase class C family)
MTLEMGKNFYFTILITLFVIFATVSGEASSFLPPIPSLSTAPVVLGNSPPSVLLPANPPLSQQALIPSKSSIENNIPKTSIQQNQTEDEEDPGYESSSSFFSIPSDSYKLEPLSKEAVLVPIDQKIINHENIIGKKFRGVVLVAQGSNVLFEQPYGEIPGLNNQRYTSDTQFLLASATKEFTAALILRAVEDGKIQLSDPVSNFFYNTPRSWEGVTVARLLNHTSGLGDYLTYLSTARKDRKYMAARPCLTNNGSFSLDADDLANESPNRATRLIAHMKPCTVPGTKFAYSNTNYFLLGKILEVISHKYLSTLFKEQIADRLGMTQSRMIDPDEKGSPVLYSSDGTPQLRSEGFYYFGVGSVYSSLHDLFLWERGLFNSDRILTTESLKKEMVTPVPQSFHNYVTLVKKISSTGSRKKKTRPNSLTDYRTESVPVSYGYGLRLIDLPGGKRLAWHAGHIEGHSTLVAHYLEDDITIIILTNETNAEIFGLEGEIAKTVFNVPGLAPRCQDQTNRTQICRARTSRRRS